MLAVATWNVRWTGAKSKHLERARERLASSLEAGVLVAATRELTATSTAVHAPDDMSDHHAVVPKFARAG